MKLFQITNYLLVRLLIAALCAGFTGIAGAATDDSDTSATAYVDSIHKWGAWELDIEPAAGGLQAPGNQPMLARNSKVNLRTNSIAALAPTAPATVITRAPAPVIPPVTAPVRPPAPVTPPVTFAPSGSVTGQTFLPPASPNIFPVSNTAK